MRSGLSIFRKGRFISFFFQVSHFGFPSIYLNFKTKLGTVTLSEGGTQSL